MGEPSSVVMSHRKTVDTQNAIPNETSLKPSKKMRPWLVMYALVSQARPSHFHQKREWPSEL